VIGGALDVERTVEAAAEGGADEVIQDAIRNIFTESADIYRINERCHCLSGSYLLTGRRAVRGEAREPADG
jgi:hypothetical protein